MMCADADGTKFCLIKVDIRTDMNDRSYIVHGTVYEMLKFLLPGLLQQKNTINRRCAPIG